MTAERRWRVGTQHGSNRAYDARTDGLVAVFTSVENAVVAVHAVNEDTEHGSFGDGYSYGASSASLLHGEDNERLRTRLAETQAENIRLRVALAGHLYDGESADTRDTTRTELITNGLAAIASLERVKATCDAATVRLSGTELRVVTRDDIAEAINGQVSDRVAQVLRHSPHNGPASSSAASDSPVDGSPANAGPTNTAASETSQR